MRWAARGRARRSEPAIVSVARMGMRRRSPRIAYAGASIKSAKAAGAPPVQLDAARSCQRKAQFLLDFVEAEKLDRVPRAAGSGADPDAVGRRVAKRGDGVAAGNPVTGRH